MAVDATTQSFEQDVIAPSREVPVVVDFWASWCGPCRALTPALERAADQRQGKVALVKVDVDANQELAARYGVQGIPAVKAFQGGEVADEFPVGAIPQAEVSGSSTGSCPRRQTPSRRRATSSRCAARSSRPRARACRNGSGEDPPRSRRSAVRAGLAAEHQGRFRGGRPRGAREADPVGRGR